MGSLSGLQNVLPDSLPPRATTHVQHPPRTITISLFATPFGAEMIGKPRGAQPGEPVTSKLAQTADSPSPTQTSSLPTRTGSFPLPGG
jgi:hypothetical protein